MSRWDALKPKQTAGRLEEVHRSTSTRRRTRGDAVVTRATSSTAAAKREGLEQNQTTSRPIFVKTAPARDEDVLAQYDSLRSKCCLAGDFTAKHNVLALTRVLQDHHCLIPAETNAGVVHTILLPWLEQELPPMPPDGEKRTGPELDVEILQTLQILLRNRKHASALLAPLTVNVEKSGTERCTVNFVRRRLFAILQKRLFHPHGEQSPFPSFDEVLCECLTTALSTATEIDDKINIKVQLHCDNHDLDTNAVLRFFGTVALTTSSSLPSLLLACLRHQPSLAPGLAKFLLLRNRIASPSTAGNSRCCRKCSFVDEGSPKFLRLLHYFEKDSAKAVVADCATALLNGLPLDVWLQPSPSRPTNKVNNNTRQTANHFFHHRVVEALESLIEICLCCCRNNALNASYLSLVKTVLTQIPYSAQEDSSLEQKASQLVDRLAWSSAATLTGANMKNKQAKSILIECMGGQTTPQGTRVPLCHPVAAWLVDAKGRSFLKSIMKSSECSCEDDDVLCAALRTCPSVVLHDATGAMWEKLQNAVLFRFNHSNLTFQAAQLIESFLRGRSDFPVMEPTIPARKLLDWILPLIEELITKSGNAAQKCSACAAYSCMLKSDWSCLAANEGHGHLTGVLSLCNDAAAKVRTQSFKTLGDVCATVQPGSYFSFENNILQSLRRAMEDTVSTVRHMALFCAGNFAQSLGLLALLPKDLDICLFCRVAKSSFELLDDHDQKVASNSCRATAFFCCVALRQDFSTRLEARECDFLTSEFLNQVLESYVLCLQSLLALAQNNAHQLSWKQRCKIKKQGRAACVSLGLLFKRGITKQTNVRNAVVCLLESVGQANVLDEKILVAACNALCLLDPMPLSQSLEMEGRTLVGRAATACYALIFHGANFRPGKDLIQAASLLLSHLMPCVRIPDAKHMILFYCPSDRDDRMRQLYTWMVANDSPPETFRSLVDAMQDTDVDIGVHVEALFASRALAVATLLENRNDCEEL